ncbi:MAG: hypothetical protein K1X53_08300 [Candidatus Sumerlaeaceae bacterium]|nr:hypothetical protein [Candidatus Sumerlaeaceae bacterium]
MSEHLAGAMGSLVFAVMTLATGWMLLRTAYRKADAPEIGDLVEVLVKCALLGVAIVTILGLGLAYAHRFSTPALFVFLGLSLLILWRWGQNPDVRIGVRRPEVSGILAVLIAAGLCAFAIVQRFDMIDGMRDPGVYTAAGIELSRTGDFGWWDWRIGSFSPTEMLRLLMVCWGGFFDGHPDHERFPGFYLGADGQVWPQFLHAYEVWLGIAYGFAGPQATQCANGVFAAFGLLAFFCTIRRIFGGPVAVVASALLAVNPATIWFSRYPSNEPYIQALVWGFLLFYTGSLVDRGDGGQNGREDRRGNAAGFYLGLLLLGVATLAKFAAWGYLIVAAFDAGLRRARGQLNLRVARLWLVFAVVAMVSVLHALLFANDYMYGSWTFTLKRVGISFDSYPVLFVALTLAALSAGTLFSAPLKEAGEYLRRRKAGMVAGGGAILLAVTAVLVHQNLQLRSDALRHELWAENTNLAEYAMYFTPGLFLVGTAGLLAMLSRRKQPALGIVCLLTAAAAIFLFRRNIDAIHPWASRRWLIVLIPMFCAGIAYLPGLLWERKNAMARSVSVALSCVVIALSSTAAPQYFFIRNFRGAIPAADKVAEKLKTDDFVVIQPTYRIAQLASYIKARFDVDLYTLPATTEGWEGLRQLIFSRPAVPPRVVYVTDSPLSAPQSVRPFLKELATVDLDYTTVTENVRTLVPTVTRDSFTAHIYEVNPDWLPAGWYPAVESKPDTVVPPSDLPMTITMDGKYEGYLRRFYAPTSLPDGKAYRWTDGAGTVFIGELLNRPISKPRVRMVVRMNSGRPDFSTPIKVEARLDNFKNPPGGVPGEWTIGPDWQDYTCEIESAKIQPDSTLYFHSIRPPVTGHSGGRLGVIIESIRLE